MPFIESSDINWNVFIKNENRDLYHLPEYVELDASLHGGRAVAWVCDFGDNRCLMPLVSRPVQSRPLPGRLVQSSSAYGSSVSANSAYGISAQGKPTHGKPAAADTRNFRDLCSPYGYPGMLTSAPLTPGDARDLLHLFHQEAAQEGFVSSFIRLNPFLNDWQLPGSAEMKQIYYGETVSINLSAYQSANQAANLSSNWSPNQTTSQTANLSEIPSTNLPSNLPTKPSEDPSTNHSTKLSADQSANLPTNQSADQSTNLPADLPTKLSINLSVNQSTNLSANQSANLSGNQSTNQSACGNSRITFNENHRRNIKRLHQQGLQVVVNDFSLMPQFIEAYYQTMFRRGAGNYYFFPEYYFRELKMLAADHLIFISVLSPTGEYLSGGLFTIFGSVMQYHLGATIDSAVKLSPSKLVIEAAIQSGIASGASILHLGGGLGGSKNDGVFRFKAGFSNDRHAFSCLQFIHNPEVYHQLNMLAGFTNETTVTNRDQEKPVTYVEKEDGSLRWTGTSLENSEICQEQTDHGSEQLVISLDQTSFVSEHSVISLKKSVPHLEQTDHIKTQPLNFHEQSIPAASQTIPAVAKTISRNPDYFPQYRAAHG